MPTIDQLPGAGAAGDADELLVSQAGVARKVTRAQLLAGTQRVIACPSGQLLGRASAGTGPLETIVVGANLSLTGGVLSAAASPFSVAALPSGRVPAMTDRVAVAQAGKDASVAYSDFLAGLASVPGLDASRMLVTPTGATSARPLADMFADSVTPEAFGAKGDGVTDDSVALSAAVSSGRPVRLGPKTYVVNGQWTIAAPAVLLGTSGQTVLRRMGQSGGAWISIQGASFAAFGITFDANRPVVAQESWGVLVTSSCLRSEFADCVFTGGQGATLGNGLTIASSDPAISQHVVRDCEMFGNSAHGLWVQAVDGVSVRCCRAHDNGGYGLCLDYNDPRFVQKLRLAQVTGNICWNNLQGISIGNYNATNLQPPTWGNANPDAVNVMVADNECHDNAFYGIAVAGNGISVQGNLLSNNGSTANGGAGILANVSASQICGNTITGGSQYGIDSGGSIDSDISGNRVSGAVVGLNAGGSQRVRVSGNFVQDCTWAVVIENVEDDGHGNNFGIASDSIAIVGNWINIPRAGGGGGVYLVDAPQRVIVARNHFTGSNGALPSQALWAHTDSVVIEDNLWNGQDCLVASPQQAADLQQLAVPDIADNVMVTSAPSGIQSIVSQHAADIAGQIAFIKVTSGGSGYTRAAVAIPGSGSRASAVPVISGGTLLGIVVTNPGAGYGGPGATIGVNISGDGTGAAAVATVGLPVWGGRRIRILCGTQVTFVRIGSVPFQENWTLYDLTVPAGAEVEWVGSGGNWQAVQFPGFGYLASTGDGGVVLQSASQGDVVLRPSGAGRVRIASGSETAGFIVCVGRGSPEGVVAAPPGSDYRNLDGGVGSTLWVKRSGQDSHGWFAIA